MSALQKFKQDAAELTVKLTMEQEKVKGYEERLQKTARQNAWLIVLLAATPEEYAGLAAKLREEDAALAGTLEDPHAAGAFRASLKLGE